MNTAPDNPQHKGRAIAWRALTLHDRMHRPVQEILETLPCDRSSRAHAVDLVCGTVRNRRALERLLELASGRPIERIAPRLRPLVQIAAYELVYCPATPDYAIVNEAVDLAHRRMGKRAAGFVNAVLRNLTRMIAERSAPLPADDPAEAHRVLPQSPGRGCRFTADVLPPAEPLGAYLAAAFSLPEWLTGEWVRRWGPDAAWRACFGSNRRPGVYMQPNTLKTSAEALAADLNKAGIAAGIVAEGRMLRLDSHVSVAQLPGYEEGLFTVQDPTAAQVAEIAASQPGQVVVDWCAAPGGKTARMAQLMEGGGAIWACDVDAERLARVEATCRRLGLANVRIVRPAERAAVLGKLERVDVLLLDVPCSNTGVLARRPEVRSRLRPEAVQRLVETQRRLIDEALSLLPAVGRIVYSTCSLLSAENEQCVEWMLQRYPYFQVVSTRLTLPAVDSDAGFDHDGGCVAVLTGPAPSANP